MKSIVLILIVFFSLSCSASKQVAQPENERESEKFDESFDPNTLNDDDIIIVKNDAAEKNAYVEPKTENLNVSSEEITFREVNGFRVQILATKNIETATLTEQEAKDLFATMEHKVYLIFDAPLYKVRVGDVTSRDDAEEIRDVAKDYGYREAFIVPSKVNIPDVKNY